MPAIFFILDFLIKNWCTFPMSLEDLLVSAVLTSGSSFAGTVVFWVWFCPNHRCCQMNAIRQAVERHKE